MEFKEQQGVEGRWRTVLRRRKGELPVKLFETRQERKVRSGDHGGTDSGEDFESGT